MTPDDAKAAFSGANLASLHRLKVMKSDPKMPTTTNNMARVHPAQPSYSVVVPAPEHFSINVAVEQNIGTIARFCKDKC